MGPDRTTPDDVRRRIREELPADTFEPQPWRALWFLPLTATALGSIATIVVARPPWHFALLLGLVAGQCFASMGFLGHEALHGAIVRPGPLQTFLGYLGFTAMLVGPTLWRTWHNQVHHGRTNRGNSDPDGFGTIERYERAPSTRFVARLAPGSRHWTSVFFFAYWFVFHGQIVLWIQSRYMRSFERMNRRRAILESALALVLWIIVAVAAGPFLAIFAVVVPLITANALVMSYIATNHFMRPLTEVNDPLENSMSVTTLWALDRLHFNFSHHVEHHLFPKVSGKHLRRVRAWLREHEQDRYVSPPHWKALAYLYRTPRVYLDANTLCDPDRPDEVRADTAELAATLSGRDLVGSR